MKKPWELYANQLKVLTPYPIPFAQRIDKHFNTFKIGNNGVMGVSDIVVTNRMADELKDVKEKLYIRDLFNNN